jgi:hypothetical protein
MLRWGLVLVACLASPVLSFAQFDFHTFDAAPLFPGAHTTEVTGFPGNGTVLATYRQAGDSQIQGVLKTCSGVFPQYALAPRASNVHGFAGWRLGPSGRREGFLAQQGRFIALEAPRDAQKRRPLATDALHLNSLGVTVGSTQSADGITHGWRYTPATNAFEVFDVPATSATEIFWQAEDDRMLARALGGDNVLRYYLWENGGWTEVTLPPLPNVDLVARQATGGLVGNSDTTGFLWDGITVIVVAVPGAIRTQLLGIQGESPFGLYVGADNIVHGFFALPSGTPDPCEADPPEGGGATGKPGRGQSKPR